MPKYYKEMANPELKEVSNLQALLHFYKAPKNREFPWFRVTHKSGAGVKNYGHDPRKVEIMDARPMASIFSLEIHSFAMIRGLAPIASADVRAEASGIKSMATGIISSHVGECHKIIVFDHVLRLADPQEKFCRPVRKVHVDQSEKGAFMRAETHLGREDKDPIANGTLRLRIINIWRPVDWAVNDHPLAFADSTTVSDTDLVEVDHIFADRIGHTLAVKFNEAQRFYWWPAMLPEDALLLQTFDSLTGARCAHASFDAEEFQGKSERRSLEIRCLVLSKLSETDWTSAEV